MTTAVIIQARMSSTRLPGKVLKEVGGQTVLAHVLERCKAIPGVDAVCVATVEGTEGDAIEEEARMHGAEVARGSLTDVLDRYVFAARLLDAKIVLRVTSDCPVIDPDICGKVLALMAEQSADYACNNMPPTWPHGLDCEAVTREWLERAWHDATIEYEREHVTPYIRNHPDPVKAVLHGPGGAYVKHRWTVDTPEDFRFFQALFEHLPPGPEGRGWESVLQVIERHPEIARINAGQVER